jgi:hypothetical protein
MYDIFLEKYSLLVDMGRNPFAFASPSASRMSTDGKWLELQRLSKWHIGDNKKYPERFIHIRSVNLDMVNFIIKHFKGSRHGTVSVETWIMN